MYVLHLQSFFCLCDGCMCCRYHHDDHAQASSGGNVSLEVWCERPPTFARQRLAQSKELSRRGPDRVRSPTTAKTAQDLRVK